jgi:universal stress protein A
VTFRRILIAVDSEPIAARAVDIGAELANALGAEIALINVVESALGYPADTGGVPPQELLALAKQDAKKLTTDFRRHLSSQSVVMEFTPVGSPATEIVRAAKDWSADMIVVGSHGRKGVQRALLGSVAEAVMRHAGCPVLVIRASE